jgi:hypothetical protein
VSDVPALQRDQVFHRQARATGVIGEDGQVRRVGRLAVDVDHRDRDLAGERRADVVAVAEHDEPVDLAGEQRANVVLLPDGIAARVAEQHGHLLGAEGVLHAEQDRDGEAAGQLVGEQSDGPGAARDQAPGKHVRLE